MVEEGLLLDRTLSAWSFFENAVDEAHENVDTRKPEKTDTQEYFGNWLPLIVHYRHTHSHFTAIFLLITDSAAHGRPCPPFLAKHCGFEFFGYFV